MRTSGWMKSTLATVGGTLVLASWSGVALGANHTIGDLAPPNSAVIIGIDNFTQAKAAFDRTGLKAIWDEPAIQTWFEKISEDFLEQFDEALSTINADRGDLTMPTGSAGLAIWLIKPEDDETPFVQFLIAADFGANADAMHQTIVSALDKGEESDELAYDREEIGNAALFTIRQLEADDADNADEDDEWAAWEQQWDDDGGFDYKNMFYARSGGHLLLGTARTEIERAIDRLAGQNVASVSDESRFQAAFAGMDAQRHAYAVILKSPLYSLTELVQEDLGQPIVPLLDALGVTEVESTAVTVRLDADRGMVAGEMFVRVPEKRGVMSLINVPAIDFVPPAFVSANASSVNILQFDIARLLPTVTQALNTLPPEIGGELIGGIQMAQGFVGPILSQLGPEIVISQSITRPFAADSQKILTAIRVKDAQALTNAITNLQGMFGLESRDFQGNTIWAPPQGMMPAGDFAIGLGFGFLFIGAGPEIENAMRAAGAGGAASLKDDARFKNAMNAIGGRGLSFSYTNMAESLDYFQWMASNYKQVMREQLREQFGDFMTDEEIEQMMEFNPAGQIYENLPDLRILRRHLGDMVGDFRITDDGIRARSMLLRPAD